VGVTLIHAVCRPCIGLLVNVRETRREPRRAPTCHLMMGRQLNEAISSLIPSLGSVRATAEADSRTRSVGSRASTCFCCIVGTGCNIHLLDLQLVTRVSGIR
jgi:hypothetical protein